MPSPTDDETPFPPLEHAPTLKALNRLHLSPDDANISPPRRPYDGDGASDSLLRPRRLHADRSTSRRRKRTWKKLMWVKQSYPDNYTDQATFLENLQRNPRLKPYDFWPLVADSTVILQHVCSVIIFIVCFVAIFQERVSPVSVVSWSSVGTFAGWILWERWVTEAQAQADAEEEASGAGATIASITAQQSPVESVVGATGVVRADTVRRRARANSLRRPMMASSSSPPTSTLAVPSLPAIAPSTAHSAARSSTKLAAAAAAVAAAAASEKTSPKLSSNGSATRNGSISNGNGAAETSLEDPDILPNDEGRAHQRLGTIKSAMLIYSTLLGLSPILKSLTRSTSSDSIWAMSFWLLAINIFFFDYSGGVGAKFPASLSTNAALMASTVLASRLPSTKQVFSLTLFSIEVFGLFPVFRRHVRHRSWQYHALVTVLLVLGAGLGLGMVMSDPVPGSWPWKGGIVGMIIGILIACVAAGGCSWWLIGLQKYKNEIRGPWDPARPIIMSRPRWD